MTRDDAEAVAVSLLALLLAAVWCGLVATGNPR